ncbi:hypothetical protein [Lysinibacillus sp. NPDC056232]|uniref:hypothetical protein n=1 Tax=Lysinibacillus sp. NPDC056232 TaxID=3345756 RepID=UPI0035D75225
MSILGHSFYLHSVGVQTLATSCGNLSVRQLQRFSVAKAKRQQQGFNCAKAKRQQQQGFNCAKAKRQQQQGFNCATATTTIMPRRN